MVYRTASERTKSCTFSWFKKFLLKLSLFKAEKELQPCLKWVSLFAVIRKKIKVFLIKNALLKMHMTFLGKISHDLWTTKTSSLSILLKVLSWWGQDPPVSIFVKSYLKQKYICNYNILVNYKTRNKSYSLFLSIFSPVIITILHWNITRIIQHKYFFISNRINESFSPSRFCMTSLTELACHSSCFYPSICLGKCGVTHMVTAQPVSVSAQVLTHVSSFCLFCNKGNLLYSNPNFHKTSQNSSPLRYQIHTVHSVWNQFLGFRRF